MFDMLGCDDIKPALDAITHRATDERQPSATTIGTRGCKTVDIDFLVALQSGSLTKDPVSALAQSDSASIREHQIMAARFVQMPSRWSRLHV
jgi:hypothetical protein